MFCDRCGTQLPGTAIFCSSCGKSVNPVPHRTTAGRVDGHVRTLGMLWIVYSAFHILSGWFVGRIFNHFGGAWDSYNFFFPGIGHLFSFALVGTGFLGLIAGWGLVERHPWARVLTIVLGIFALLRIPLGTALGVYTLWVLLPSESARDYERTARV